MTPEEIIADVTKLTLNMSVQVKYRRVRYAVTHEEFAALQVYGLKHWDKSYNHLGGVVLVVEEHPESPPLIEVS
jgi:hypothetical protein